MARNVDPVVLALGNVIEVNAHASVLEGRSFVVTKLPPFIARVLYWFLLVARMIGLSVLIHSWAPERKLDALSRKLLHRSLLDGAMKIIQVSFVKKAALSR